MSEKRYIKIPPALVGYTQRALVAHYCDNDHDRFSCSNSSRRMAMRILEAWDKAEGGVVAIDLDDWKVLVESTDKFPVPVVSLVTQDASGAKRTEPLKVGGYMFMSLIQPIEDATRDRPAPEPVPTTATSDSAP